MVGGGGGFGGGVEEGRGGLSVGYRVVMGVGLGEGGVK